MSAPTIYYFDHNGCFTGETRLARQSPADKDEPKWLIPGRATTEAPPEAVEGEIAVWRDGAWLTMADHRGRPVYEKATGSRRLHHVPGDLDDSLTFNEPPTLKHIWNGVAWALPLADAREAKRRAVDAKLAQILAAGFVYNDKRYQIDERSQALIAHIAIKADHVVRTPGAIWKPTFRFTAADNTRVPYTAAQFVAFADAVADHIINIHERSRDLKDEIIAAGSTAALDAININAGWSSI